MKGKRRNTGEGKREGKEMDVKCGEGKEESSREMDVGREENVMMKRRIKEEKGNVK